MYRNKNSQRKLARCDAKNRRFKSLNISKNWHSVKLTRRLFIVGFLHSELDSKLFCAGPSRPPGAVDGARNVYKRYIGAEVIKRRAFGEIREVGGTYPEWNVISLKCSTFEPCLLTQGCGGQVEAPTTGHRGSSCPHNLGTDTEAGSTIEYNYSWREATVFIYIDSIRMFESIRTLVEWIFTAGIWAPLRFSNLSASFDHLFLSIF